MTITWLIWVFVPNSKCFCQNECRIQSWTFSNFNSVTSAGDINTLYNYCPLTKLREGNVFTCVYLSVHGGPHVTITYDALDLTLQPPPGHQTLDLPLAPTPLLMKYGGHHCKSLQTCSFGEPHPGTSCGGHWCTYGLHAGGMYPTWMLSCWCNINAIYR